MNGDGYADVLVGAPEEDLNYPDEGRVSLHLGSPSGISPTPSWTAWGNQASAHFGAAVAGAGDVDGDGLDDFIVGAPGYNDGQSAEGLVFLWYGKTVWPANPQTASAADWMAESNFAGASFGTAISIAGDVNGDLVDDILVGAPNYNSGGRVYLWYGASRDPQTPRPSGNPSNAAWYAQYSAGSQRFGQSVAIVTDVNHDKFDDVLIGAPGYSDPLQGNEGAAFLWYGSSSGLGPPGTPSNAAWHVEGNAQNTFVGESVASAGDLNGDGVFDIAIGAPERDAGSTFNVGQVCVWYGKGIGLNPDSNFTTSADWCCFGTVGQEHRGASVAFAGDTNGDGYDDLIVGSPFLGITELGKADVWMGAPGGLSACQDSLLFQDCPQVDGLYGRSASTAGDLNGDGADDLIVGAPQCDEGQVLNQGIAYVYLGILSSIDGDGDGLAPSLGDCNDRDFDTQRLPGEVSGFSFLDNQSLIWLEPLDRGGSPSVTLQYDLLRSPTPGDFRMGTQCVESHDVDTMAIDSAAPPSGQAYYYLVGADNSCGRGSLGQSSDGVPRLARRCGVKIPL